MLRSSVCRSTAWAHITKASILNAFTTTHRSHQIYILNTMSTKNSAATVRASSTPWQSIAIASGICAALNAIFAKLYAATPLSAASKTLNLTQTTRTTNTLTTSLSSKIASAIHLPSNHVDILLRAAVFGLSFLFTGTMWALYTRALSVSPSAVKVNIVNTASNFIVTAVLGALVFGERLPPLWWVGAGLLVAGSVVIGRREEGGVREAAEKKEQ